MYILVNTYDNPLRLLTFIATPSRAPHSRAAGTWSSNLNTLTTLSVAQVAANRLAAPATKLAFSIRFTITNVLASVPRRGYRAGKQRVDGGLAGARDLFHDFKVLRIERTTATRAAM